MMNYRVCKWLLLAVCGLLKCWWCWLLMRWMRLRAQCQRLILPATQFARPVAVSNIEAQSTPAKLAFGKHRCKPEWVTQWVIQAKAYSAKKGCRTIANDFNLAYASKQMSISKSFVHKTLREHAYAVGDLRRKWRHKLPFPCSRNAVWAMDLTGKQIVGASNRVPLNALGPPKSKAATKQSPGSKPKSKHAIETIYIAGIIDHGSRLALCLKPLHSKHGWRLALCLVEAVVRYGTPKAIRTDNDRVFTGVVFRTVLAVLGIKHQRTALASPWQNGRIERLFGTLKPLLDLKEVSSMGALCDLMDGFRAFYNEVRPHQNLNGLTPAMAWAGLSWADLRQIAPKSVLFVCAWDCELTGYRLRF